MMAKIVKQLKAQDRNVRELETKLHEKYKKLVGTVNEQKDSVTNLEQKISSSKSEVSALCKSVEELNECQKKLETRFNCKRCNGESEIWEGLRHVIQGHVLQHKIVQDLKEELNELKIVLYLLKSAQNRCPFVDRHDNPMIKVVVQILNIDRKYIVAICFCLVIGLAMFFS